MKRSWAGEVRNVSLLVAIGVSGDGYRDILGICEGHKEDKAGWQGFLKHLKQRGLTGVRLIISDARLGLVEAAGELYPDAGWQRCTVGLLKNSVFVPARDVVNCVVLISMIFRPPAARGPFRRVTCGFAV